MWLYLGREHRLSSVAHPQDEGRGIYLVHAQRVRTKPGYDSQHHRGKGDVVEMSQ